MKKGAVVTLMLSSNVVGDSNNENDFLHKSILSNTQVSKLHKTFGKWFSS